MPTSRPTPEPRSGDTLDCSTGAIILREGAGAVVSSYLTESESALGAAPTQTQTPSPVTRSPMPEQARRAWPIVRPGPATERARARELAALAKTPDPKRLRQSRSRSRSRSPAASTVWIGCGTFALGAAMAAVAGLVVDRGDLLVAMAASSLVGALTVAVVLVCSSRKH